LIALGLLSDIFDGIIARRLKISTQKLRRMDSTVDQFFWLCVIVTAYLISPVFFKDNLVLIIIVLALEAVCYLLSFIKFKKEVATHAISSKIWALVLFATLIQIIATGNSVTLFYICFYLGIATRLEIISILLILKEWANDIPTVYHAVLIKKGREIKRHKLFNG
jgi:CDP-diacylglycerol--glycerol-3-phosphate 3-phosphatidyltransferase